MRSELTDPHHITAGYVGVPGDRTFYVQAEDTEQRVTIQCEKEQVGAIGQLLTELLARVDDQPATDWDRDAMALREPLDALWRVGALSVGLDPERERFLLELAELVPDEEEPEEVRIWLSADQARRLAAHATESVGQGRPRCQLCGRPDGPGGHVCPATNGHGELSR